MRLTLLDHDTSWWFYKDGSTGMYMGIGWGSMVMKGSDFNTCRYIWADYYYRFLYDDWSYPYSADDDVYNFTETFDILEPQ